MDFTKLSRGTQIVIGGSIAFLIASIFNWQEVEFADIASAGVSMWHGWGVLAGILAIALLVWEGARAAKVKIEIGLSPTPVSALLAILLLVVTLLKFLVDNEFRTFWAWLGLALSIVILLGALENMRGAGESLSDMRKGVATAAAGAAGAVRSATERSPGPGGSGEAPQPPPTPPAATEPDAPAPPAPPPEEDERPQ